MGTSSSAGLLKVENNEILLFRSGTDKINIFNIVVEFNFYQDIFSPFLSGSLVIIDSIGLISEAKYDGTERIKITVSNPYDPSQKKYTLEFIISSITNREMENYKSNSYILHLVSNEAISNANTTLVKKYSGKPEEIIKTILTNDLKTTKEFVSESTKFTTEFIAAKWNPFFTASWLAGKSISTQNNNASFFFYEDFNGFNFKSLQGNTSDLPYMAYKIRSPNLANSSEEPNLVFNLSTPIDFKVKESSNILENISNGMFNSTLYIKDHIKNEYIRSDYEYQKDFTSSKKLNSIIPFKTLFEGDGVTRVGYNNSNSYTLADSNHQLDWYQKRISLLEQINITCIQLTVPGLFSLQVGNKITLEVPKVIIDSDGNVLDKQLSGIYVVTALRHISPDKNQHYMVLEIIKESHIL